MLAKHVKINKKIREIVCIVLAVGLLGMLAVAGLNGIVVGTASAWILSEQEAAALPDVDCVLVLGCLVKDDGVPSDMLHDRLRQG